MKYFCDLEILFQRYTVANKRRSDNKNVSQEIYLNFYLLMKKKMTDERGSNNFRNR
jgi:hypothetical protein